MSLKLPFVEETRFGNWFLNTNMWRLRVLERALNDLQRLLPAGHQYARILDVGCGFGHSFTALAKRFQPLEIVGFDADPHFPARAQSRAQACEVPVTLVAGNASLMQGLEDNSFDMVFCHQTFHHIVNQQEAMAEFFRVLKPGGVLLFAESTKRYIHSLQIRLLFRHPMHVQKTAEEYIAMIRQAGFSLPEERISLPFLWWSRPDGGFLEWIGVPVPEKREETLVNAVAIKPI